MTLCNCGSKQAATKCCDRPEIKGLITPIDPSLGPVTLPAELLIIENYLDNDTCEQLINYADQQAGAPAPVGDTSLEKSVGNKLDKAFVADRIEIDLDKDIYLKCMDICKNVFSEHIGSTLNIDMEWFELPHILRYGRGGFYVSHSDSENFDLQSQTWIKGIDRDYSGVMYLNEGYTGGTLAFPNYNLRLHPKPGMLACFPSNHKFIHYAEEVKSGLRYAMVTWGAAKGTARVPGGRPSRPIML
jgi:hypothetical protein